METVTQVQILDEAESFHLALMPLKKWRIHLDFGFFRLD